MDTRGTLVRRVHLHILGTILVTKVTIEATRGHPAGSQTETSCKYKDQQR